MELEKSNMDDQMLQHEAINLAKKCYSGKNISQANITNMQDQGSDPTGAILAGVLTKLDVTKKALGQ